MRPVLPGIISVVLLAGTVSGGETLLLNGFEPETIKSWAGKLKKKLRTGKDGLPTWSGMAGKLVPGDATEGQHAMVRKMQQHLKYLSKRGLESKRRTVGLLLKTFAVFKGCYPEDWSAYAKLRLDIKTEDAPLLLRLGLEDAIISPPLSRKYQIPAGKWVTVEYDLAEASRPREVELSEKESKRFGVEKLVGRIINLKKMAGVCLMVELLDKPTTVKLDNIRLVAAGKKEDNGLPVITDARPFPVPTTLPVSKSTPREKIQGKFNKAPVAWEEPTQIQLKGGSYGLQPFDVVPVDNDRMLLAVSTTHALKTTDGGKTWTGLDGTPSKPTRVIDHDTNAPGRIAAAMGPDLMVLGTAKCSGRGTPVDSYSVLVRFDGSNWKPHPRGLVDVDDRHCPEHRVRAVRLPSGRIWACWMHEDRWYRYRMRCRYSDDEGKTWRDAAANGLIELTTRGRKNPFAVTWWLEKPAMPDWTAEQAMGNIGRLSHDCRHSHMQLAPWGEHVICAFMDKRKIVTSAFDGKRWSTPQPADIPGEPASMVSFEGERVYLATSAGKVFRLEEEKWLEDSPPEGVGQKRLPFPGCDRTRLSVAGKVLVAVWTDGKKLFTNQKPQGGSWSKTREIFNEERGVHHIGAPVRSVENFVPFVWSITKGGARFVRIPVTQPGK